ncbi:stage V sporulation protein AD [Sporomusa acidovorans]|uniref:Stage V sporulation protein AD n=1 Tax=Sporomusa acidovorans (strain ATCC 49682 / DSM 3132 / Mol) TaxID=1123286 RepID=A0ABZ3J1R5_SPOA4|nr:stage V sporulation protein AD [Sporomusa acidovorans]OZC23211.1 stage V sporulation protein AD [Sporomusa acidovorans DSM 3132]SDE97752.1 stage V sporulation protein AD [Sporomusa acidovorans]
MLHGHQTWVFESKPVIIGSAAIGGPFEAQGNLADDFDLLHGDIWLGQDSYEQAEKKLLEQACETAIKKAGLKKEDVQFFLSGDLMNQIIPSSFAARTLAVPFFGIYGACSSSMEGLALAALMIDSRFAQNALVGTSSHNAASEKQYRYPTEYGAQKPPTAQWTVTGAGAALVAQQGEGPHVAAATIGRVIDMGLSDPFNMGAAMAPAAVDTIEAHFRDLNISPSYYDLITTGDLGRVGHRIAGDLLTKHGLDIPVEKLTDCGILIYKETQPVLAGGSGCACVATTTFGHLLNRMRKGELNRILVIATGALLSPMSYQQKETIPCIAYAVSIEK